MLRLKQAIDELRISQQAVVNLTGWSKAQISITLNTGEFPKDAKRFKASIRAFVGITPPLEDWLTERGLQLDALFDEITENELTANEHGEIPGIGPEWRCDEHGQPGHNYQECYNCHRRYDGYLKRLHGRAAVMGTGVTA